MHNDSIISTFVQILPSNRISTNVELLQQFATTTFQTSQKIQAILYPISIQEIQAIFKVANLYKIAIYPISKGKNWGYGSKVPTQNNAVVVSLEQMNRILEFHETLGYIVVQPGVTFQQVHDLLQTKGGKFVINPPGSSPHTSIIGNTLERGITQSIYGDRNQQICGLEVVLPNGKVIQTGLSRYQNAKAKHLQKYGVGASFDELFVQSNLGIVTQLTLWLMPRPAFYQQFFCTVSSPLQWINTLQQLQVLKLNGVIDTIISCFNDYKIISILQQYPYKITQKTPLPNFYKNVLIKKIGGGKWFIEGCICGATELIVAEKQRLIQQSLNQANDLTFKQLNDNHNPFFSQNLQTGLATAYWRKKQKPSKKSLHPDLDKCGIIWHTAVLPFDGNIIQKTAVQLEKLLLQQSFEPLISIQILSPRCVYLIISIVYDRNQINEDKKAMNCYQTISEWTIQEGFYPYRLGLQNNVQLPQPNDDSNFLLQTLKQATDPNRILAFGRYEF